MWAFCLGLLKESTYLNLTLFEFKMNVKRGMPALQGLGRGVNTLTKLHISVQATLNCQLLHNCPTASTTHSHTIQANRPASLAVPFV